MKKKFLTNKDKKEILRVFNKIENLRAKNNKNWMDILKLSFLNNPKETYKLISQILNKDSKMIKLEKKLKKFT
tara:strand:+ start:955 stop:1173 length:219 start_codon:yes stop_codon:yes gene_type:complete